MMDGKVSPGEVTRNFYRKQGATEERERIIQLFEEMVELLEAMRPESYKSVADKADLRIRTVNMMLRKLKGED